MSASSATISVTPANTNNPVSVDTAMIDSTSPPPAIKLLRPSSANAQLNPLEHNHSNAVHYTRTRSPSGTQSRPGSGSSRNSRSNSINQSVSVSDSPYVFLGGSCDPTTWRNSIAIPALISAGILYFNPQTNDWDPSLIALEAKAKSECEILLFVIDSSTRAIGSMLEATEYIMSNRRVVLVILDLPDGIVIDGELVGERQLLDLNRGRAFLCDIAARHQQYTDVFQSVEAAINHIIYSHPGKGRRRSTVSAIPAASATATAAAAAAAAVQSPQ